MQSYYILDSSRKENFFFVWRIEEEEKEKGRN